MASKADQARSRILEWIRTGQLRPGQRLESERELGRRLGMNHQTVRRALARLSAEGFIIKRPRMGNFVRDASDLTPVALVLPTWIVEDSLRQSAVGPALEGIAQSLHGRRYALTVLHYRPEHFWEDAAQMILERGIRGVLLHAHYRLPAEQLRRLVERGLPVVGLTHHLHLQGLRLPTYSLDRAAILSNLLSGLVERGHRRIAVIRYRRPATPSVEAVLAEFESNGGLEGLIENSLWLANAYEVDYDSLEVLFERRPTAVVAPDECVASDIFRRCYQRGLRIPDQMSLAAGYDLTPQAHAVPLTAPDSLRWIRHAACQAGEHLRKLLESGNPPPAHVRFNPPVLWKASVARVLLEGTMGAGAGCGDEAVS